MHRWIDMNLIKMKRCSKAVHGFKGIFKGDTIFEEISQLKTIMGEASIMVLTEKWPEVPQPGWFIVLTPASKWGGGTNSVNFTIYVNDEQISNNLLSMVSPTSQ